MSDIEQELLRELGAPMEDRETMQACVDTCRAFGLDAQTLRYKWEAFAFNPSWTRPIDLEGARALRAQIKRDLDNKVEAAAKARAKNTGAGTRTGKLFNTGPRVSASSGLSKIQPQKHSVAFKTSFKGPDSSRSRPYRYMFEKQSARSDCLDVRINKFADLLRQHYQLEELGDPSDVTESEVVVVGRVVSDSDAKLNEASMMLESSRLLGSGFRTPIKFDPAFRLQSGLPFVDLFPGMILAARGKNGGGEFFSITDVIDFPLPRLREIEMNSIDPFNVIFAAGPFSSSSKGTGKGEELHFRDFHLLLDKLKSNPPSLLVLLGPFMDAQNTAFRLGKLAHSPTILFGKYFGAPLREFCKACPSTRVLLVSSLREILNPHYVFPQGAFEADGLNLPEGVVILPNPSNFTVNGVRFAVSTVDVFRDMQKERFRKQAPQNGETTDLMQELCRQLVLQRSFYPVFPVPIASQDTTEKAKLSGEEQAVPTNLDVSHLQLLDFDSFYDDDYDSSPDVLVVPSMLKHFHKSIEHITLLNPPAFHKGGLIGRLVCQPKGNEKLADSISVSFDKLIA